MDFSFFFTYCYNQPKYGMRHNIIWKKTNFVYQKYVFQIKRNSPSKITKRFSYFCYNQQENQNFIAFANRIYFLGYALFIWPNNFIKRTIIEGRSTRKLIVRRMKIGHDSAAIFLYRQIGQKRKCTIWCSVLSSNVRALFAKFIEIAIVKLEI